MSFLEAILIFMSPICRVTTKGAVAALLYPSPLGRTELHRFSSGGIFETETTSQYSPIPLFFTKYTEVHSDRKGH